MSTSYREAAIAYNNIKDIEEEKVSTTYSGLLARTNSKMSKDVNKDEPLDRVTRVCTYNTKSKKRDEK